MIFSILLQHHISKFSSFWSAFRSVHVHCLLKYLQNLSYQYEIENKWLSESVWSFYDNVIHIPNMASPTTISVRTRCHQFEASKKSRMST
jgi:hypothetical protein